MKKKAALLLALVMVLSLLPVMAIPAFGSGAAGDITTRNPWDWGGLANDTYGTHAAADPTITIRNTDWDGLLVPQGGLFLIFDLSGGNRDTVRFANGTGWTAGVTTSANYREDPRPGGLTASVLGLNSGSTDDWLEDRTFFNNNRRMVYKISDDAITNGRLTALPAGYNQWGLENVRADAGGVELRVWIARQGARGEFISVSELADGLLTWPWPTAGVYVEAAVAPMLTAVELDTITLTERYFGRAGVGFSSGNRAIRLTAPRGFVWETGQIAGISSTDFNATGDGPLTVNDSDVMINTVNNRGQGVLVVTVDFTVDRTGVLGFHEAGVIELNNLVLIATPQAATTGLVDVQIEFGTWAFGERFRNVAREHSGEREDASGNWMGPNMGLVTFDPERTHVTVQDDNAGITWKVYDDGDIPEAGFVRNSSGLPGNVGPNASFGSVNRFTATDGVTGGNFSGANWAATLPLAERGGVAGRVLVLGPEDNAAAANVFNALSGRETGSDHVFLNGNFFTIRLLESIPGAMRGIETYEFHLVQDGVRILQAEYRFGDDSDPDNETDTDWFEVENPPAGSDPEILYAMSGINRDQDVFTLGVRPAAGGGSDRMHRDVRFRLDIEPGFAAAHGDVVEMDVFRDGELLERVVIANVTDPITVESNMIRRVETMPGGTLIPNITPGLNVTITETATARLDMGELWIRIIPVMAGHNVELVHNPIQFAIDSVTVNEESGVRVSSQGFEYVYRDMTGEATPPSRTRVYVVRMDGESFGEPAVISLNNIFITAGALVPNAELMLIVDGPAVSQNSWLVVEADLEDTDDNEGFRGMPYATEIANEIGGIVVGVPNVAPFTWNVFTGMVDNRIPFRIIDGDGMTSARSFAHQIGATTRHDPVANEAVIDGIHQVTGHELTVLIPTAAGSPTIRIINRTLHTDTGYIDMAAFQRLTRGTEGPANGTLQVRLYNGQAMLPIRVLGLVFGFDTSWDAATQSATFTSLRV